MLLLFLLVLFEHLICSYYLSDFYCLRPAIFFRLSFSEFDYDYNNYIFLFD